MNDWTMPHSSQMILFVSSTWSSSSHPNNIMYEGIATRSKALTQHISSSNGTKKGDNLAPLENYMDNTWGPLGETLRPLREGWPHQNGWIFGRVPNDLWPPLHRSFSKNDVANCSNFMLKKPCLKVHNHKFLDWKWPRPPKNHPFWWRHLSLM